MSIRIYKHDTIRGIKKESTSNLVSSRLCWQSACDLKKKKSGGLEGKRSAKCLSLSTIHLEERHQELVCEEKF